jgi:hypothetical protein
MLKTSPPKEIILVIDEIQKISNWTETVKALWDEDTLAGNNIKLVLLGSSPLIIQKGVSESLGGRFETIQITHWSYKEMRDAFNVSLEQYIFFGGYPGAVSLINDHLRWKNYISNSLIETTILRDILYLTAIDKPALLKQLFDMGCAYSGQILSYNKMIGQLQDAGNTTTLAHYLNLLSGAGLLTGIQKYAGETFRKRGSSPKFQVCNNALMSARLNADMNESMVDYSAWGRLVESAVGSHLYNLSLSTDMKMFYWREGALEVDFVLEYKKKLIALEVKSGIRNDKTAGLSKFCGMYKKARPVLVGKHGLPLEEFLVMNADDLF